MVSEIMALNTQVLVFAVKSGFARYTCAGGGIR
jgi:hypothetical protein